MATQLHCGVITAKMTAPTMGAAAVASWAGCSETGKAWAILVATVDVIMAAEVDATADAAARWVEDTNAVFVVAAAIVVVRRQCPPRCPLQLTAVAPAIAADAAKKAASSETVVTAATTRAVALAAARDY
jgi:hypothetical protein